MGKEKSEEPPAAVSPRASKAPKLDLPPPVPDPTTALHAKNFPQHIATSAAAADAFTPGNVDALKPGLYSKVVALCTVNFNMSSERCHERGDNKAYLQCVVLHIANAGYVKSPYEPKNDVPKKQRVFFDEKGQAVKGAPVPTMAMQGMELQCRSYQKHPTPALKTKGRGEVTEVVGAVYPGLNLSFSIWDDAKDRIIPDKATQDRLVPFSLVCLELDVKCWDQCEKGYGLELRKVAALDDSLRLHAPGLLSTCRTFHDQAEMHSQLMTLCAQKSISKMMDSDVAFMRYAMSFREDSTVPSAGGLVVLPKETVQGKLTFEVLPTNQHLRVTVHSPGSAYDAEPLLVLVDGNEFTVPNTSADWLQSYYQWCSDAGIASLAIVHDEYRRSKARENGSMYGMRAMVVVDHTALFANARTVASAAAPPVVFSAAQAEALQQATGKDVRSLPAGTVSAWTVGSEKMVVVVDHAKELSIVGEAGEEGEVEEVEKTHLSPVCEIYRGMNKARKVWLAFFCRVSEDSVQVVQAGICARPAMPSSSMKFPRSGPGERTCDLLQ